MSTPEDDNGRSLQPAGSDAPLPIPKALYSCLECREEYSWPAEDLFWSAKCEAWICDNCWDHEGHGEPGIRLDREIKRQNTPGEQPARTAQTKGPQDE